MANKRQCYRKYAAKINRYVSINVWTLMLVCVCAVAGTHVLLVKLFVALNVCVPTLSDVVAVFLTTCFQNHMNRILDIRRLPWLIIKHTNGQVNQFQFGDHSFIHSSRTFFDCICLRCFWLNANFFCRYFLFTSQIGIEIGERCLMNEFHWRHAFFVPPTK